MSVLKIFLISLSVFFILNGCQGNNSSSPSSGTGTDVNNSTDANATLPPSNPAIVKIHLEKASLDITANSQVVNVNVLAFDEYNQTMQTGSIFVRYPTEIVDKNISGGKFNENEVAINNGVAKFTFVGPDTLTTMDPLNFTFVYKENEDITANLRVNYVPAVPIVILNKSSETITKNSEILNININVVDGNNVPYPNGNIKIFYPNDVRSGRDIGSFASSTVPVLNGKATFVYTAPSNLDDNTSDIVFKFYHEANPIDPKTFTVKIVPDPNQIVLNSYVLKSSIADDNVSMGILSSKLMSFYVSDDSGNLVSDSNISSIIVSMLNPTLGTLEDTEGNRKTTLTFSNKNNITVNLKTKTISGIIPLRVTSSFLDSNNKKQNIVKVFNVVVLSGPPSAISFSYADSDSTSKKSDSKMIEHWVITVTDRYNNLVNTNPAVSMGAIVGYAKSSPTKSSHGNNYLYYLPNEVNGILSSTNNDFEVNSTIFANVDDTNDYLVTFGNAYKYNASGKWDITNKTNNTLGLIDTYSGNDTSNLAFAVGHNYRQDTCQFGQEWVANVYPEKAGNYIIDNTGSMRISIEYDYYLVGKDIMLWANIIGKQYDNNSTVKIGEAHKVSLRGTGLTSEASYKFDKGYSGTFRFHISISDSVEWYRNANFRYAVNITSDVNKSITDSMKNGITSCVNDGRAYVDVTITSPAPKAGTVSLVNLLPSDEF